MAGQLRIIDLQYEAGIDDCLILIVQCIGKRDPKFLVALVYSLLFQLARFVGETAGINASSHATFASAAFKLSMSRCSASRPR
jgi:hypothetical protein